MVIDYFVKTMGCFVGGIVMMYACWFLLNTQRKSLHTDIYNKPASVCLAIGSLLLSCAFLYGLLNNPVYQTIQYWLRITVELGGLISLCLAMYYYENEKMEKHETENMDKAGV